MQCNEVKITGQFKNFEALMFNLKLRINVETIILKPFYQMVALSTSGSAEVDRETV